MTGDGLNEYQNSQIAFIYIRQYKLTAFIVNAIQGFNMLLERTKDSWHFIVTFVTKTAIAVSVTREKSPNVHKSCPKIISQEKLKILAPTQKLPKTVEDLGI